MSAAALATLAACATPTVPPPQAETPAAAATIPQPEPAPEQASDTPAPADQNIDFSPAARAARLAGRPPPPPETGREPPARLIGLSREFVLELLGPAGFIRRDGPVQIWRYADDDCFLDVFLFREGDAFRVNHVEARSKNAEQMISVNACYQRLFAAHRAGRTG